MSNLTLFPVTLKPFSLILSLQALVQNPSPALYLRLSLGTRRGSKVSLSLPFSRLQPSQSVSLAELLQPLIIAVSSGLAPAAPNPSPGLGGPAGCLEGLCNQMSPAPIDHLSPQTLNFLATRLVPAIHRESIVGQPSCLAQGPTGAWVLFSSLCGLSQSHSTSPQVNSPPACWFFGTKPACCSQECLLGDLSLCCNQILYVLDAYSGPLKCALECCKTNSSGFFFFTGLVLTAGSAPEP